MTPFLANAIIVLILVASVSGAIWYIYKEKKKGRHCIGCPMAGNCPKHNHCEKKGD